MTTESKENKSLEVKLTREDVEEMIENKIESQGYDGWLVSENFLKRSIAVLGHYWFAAIFIIVVVYSIAFIVGFVAGPTGA